MSEDPTSGQQSGEMTTWPDLAIGLYDRLTGRQAEIIYEFEDMSVSVPRGIGEDTAHAEWILDGTVSITTRERE